MSTEQLDSINDLARFINGSQKVAFEVLGNKRQRYLWVQSILKRFDYHGLKKPDKSVVVTYIKTISGYSRQQLVRLINRHRKTGTLNYTHKATHGFGIKYTRDDILALVAMDELHGTLNGVATKKLCERAWLVYSDPRYARLANISVSHLYNLRSSKRYKNQRILLEKTKPVASQFGERRKPRPNGAPGYLRVDTVHQGDFDGQKGVYHINAVDEVTQFEVLCSVEKISEAYLQPQLEYILNAFPFKILGFHTDNGSEYVNSVVAKLLNKLLVEFTKSRARKSNDNALAESKNGSIVRKIFGYAHIPSKFANLINNFNRKYLNYYLNYHRPCLFASSKVNSKGKEVKQYRYENAATPYEKLKSLSGAEQYLKAGVTFEDLDYKANLMSDSEAAKQMQLALKELLSAILNEKERHVLAECSNC